MKAHGFHPVDFIVNVWTLRIDNIDKKIGSSRLVFINKIPLISKLGNKSVSRDAFNCNVTYNIIDNRHTRYSRSCPLFRARNGLPSECESGTLINEENNDGEKRMEYIRKLPSNYRGLLLNNPEHIDLHKKTQSSIILFFTFEDSDSLFFVSKLNDELQNDNFSQFTFPLETELDLKIKFQSQQPNYSEEVSYRVIPTSWEDISIQRIN